MSRSADNVKRRDTASCARMRSLRRTTHSVNSLAPRCARISACHRVAGCYRVFGRGQSRLTQAPVPKTNNTNPATLQCHEIEAATYRSFLYIVQFAWSGSLHVCPHAAHTTQVRRVSARRGRTAPRTYPSSQVHTSRTTHSTLDTCSWQSCSSCGGHGHEKRFGCCQDPKCSRLARCFVGWFGAHWAPNGPSLVGRKAMMFRLPFAWPSQVGGEEEVKWEGTESQPRTHGAEQHRLTHFFFWWHAGLRWSCMHWEWTMLGESLLLVYMCKRAVLFSARLSQHECVGRLVKCTQQLCDEGQSVTRETNCAWLWQCQWGEFPQTNRERMTHMRLSKREEARHQVIRVALVERKRSNVLTANGRLLRMVAHNVADLSFLFAVMVRRRAFFQEDPSIVLFAVWLFVAPVTPSHTLPIPHDSLHAAKRASACDVIPRCWAIEAQWFAFQLKTQVTVLRRIAKTRLCRRPVPEVQGRSSSIPADLKTLFLVSCFGCCNLSVGCSSFPPRGALSCYPRHVRDLLADGRTPYERRFGEPFSGPVIPHGSMIEFHPISAKDQSRLHQFGRQFCQESSWAMCCVRRALGKEASWSRTLRIWKFWTRGSTSIRDEEHHDVLQGESDGSQPLDTLTDGDEARILDKSWTFIQNRALKFDVL